MRALPDLMDGKGEPGRFGAGGVPLRRKGGALLASLLLHAIGLAGVVVAMRGPDTPVTGPRASLVTVELRPATPPHGEESPKAADRQPAADRRTLAPVPVRQPAAVPPASAQAASVGRETAPVPTTERKPAVSFASAAPEPVAEARRTPPADAVEAYRLRLWRKIMAARPQDARGAGRVVLRFRIDRQGRLVSADVSRSSGVPALDRLALRAIHAAAPFSPPPAEMDDSGLSFSVPIDFHG